jgi:hypothetical protein
MSTSYIELDVMYEALTELDFYSRFISVSSNIHNLKLLEGETMPDLTIIQNKCNEIRPSVYSKYAFKYLRTERNKLLTNSDKYIISDFPHPTEEVKQAWISYRQTLRDLPSTATPELDGNGNLTNVTWPTQPS